MIITLRIYEDERRLSTAERTALEDLITTAADGTDMRYDLETEED